MPAASSVLLPLICTIQLSINLRKRRQLKRKGGMVCSYGICIIDPKQPQTPRGVGYRHTTYCAHIGTFILFNPCSRSFQVRTTTRGQGK
ncbi:hypothetical protein BDZ97DRAFT_189734 [Flammula alnicola]|nr:hypothetical protein BDZ97DRAFT_189734 [Flammula alnicola]